MIDIHCHILPGVDDGAQHEQACLSMAKMAAREGITAIIATPHYDNGTYENTKDDIIESVAHVNALFKEEQIDLNVYPGQEPRISGEMLEKIETGEIVTLNDTGKYIFVELPHNHVPRYTERLLYDIQLKGLTPIIVHPERNHEIMKTPGMIYELVKSGALTQITASSVTGHFGKQIRQLTMELIENNLTHFVASDAHNTGKRTFRMREALEQIEDEFGMDMRYLLQENAELLFEGKAVVKEIPQRIRKKKFLGLF
jgi:protein-tyrosine phosphatase